jgi:hypothetical protein
MSWISLLFFAFSIFIMIFDPDTLKALMATPLWFVALWLFWKINRSGRANAAGEAERLTDADSSESAVGVILAKHNLASFISRRRRWRRLTSPPFLPDTPLPGRPCRPRLLSIFRWPT